MLKIEISEEVKTSEDMITVLERIAELVKQGYTSGYDPDWKLTGEEEINYERQSL